MSIVIVKYLENVKWVIIENTIIFVALRIGWLGEIGDTYQ